MPPHGPDLTGQVAISRSSGANYRLKVGTGASTDVYQGEWIPHEALVAVKIFRSTEKDDAIRVQDINRRVIRESNVWLGLNHPHILSYLGYCTDLGLSVALISPFCSRGTIKQYLRQHVTANRQSFVNQVVNGLWYLHANNIIHGDLQGNNVLVDNSHNARLCDFGRAKVIGDAEYSTALVAGCAPYMAPELFPEDERLVDQLFSPSSDIYAFGMLAFEIFTDEVPFISLGAHSQFRIMAIVIRGDRPSRSSDTQQRISDDMWEIMQRCWVANPIARPTAFAIVQRI